MKSIYLIALFLANNSHAYCQPKDSSDIISISVDIIGSYHCTWTEKNNQCDKLNEADRYFTLLTITNNADTTIHYATWYCSWEENWTSTNDSIYLDYDGCDINSPITVKLNPHQSIKYYCILRAKDENIQDRKFRLGFSVLTMGDLLREFATREAYLAVRNKRQIYWSSELSLQSHLFSFKIDDHDYGSFTNKNRSQ